MPIVSTTVGRNPLEEMEIPHWGGGGEGQNSVLGYNLKNDTMISTCFQGKSLNITVIQVYVSTTDAKEAESDQFYEDLQHHTPKKSCPFHHRGWLECKGRMSRATYLE